MGTPDVPDGQEKEASILDYHRLLCGEADDETRERVNWTLENRPESELAEFVERLQSGKHTFLDKAVGKHVDASLKERGRQGRKERDH